MFACADEVPVGFLPADWVSATLQKTLSPQGRFAWVIPAGPVRITDTPDRIEAARRALGELQEAPALVPLDISFATTSRRTVQRLPAEPPVVDRGFPVPNRYDPPRVIMNGSGGFTVIPSQPRDFGTRSVGSGDAVIPPQTGYQTQQSEVRLTETTATGGVTRRFTASAVPGKAITIAVLPQADAAALRALAIKLGAVAEAEPAWPAAATELLIRPDLSRGTLVVNVTPQIVLAQGRRVPLPACAAAVMVARGAPSSTGLLPRTDPEFYRVFLGTPQAQDETITTLTVAARVQYIGSPPK